jgi:uncharacterized protein (TIGR00369 family)
MFIAAFGGLYGLDSGSVSDLGSRASTASRSKGRAMTQAVKNPAMTVEQLERFLTAEFPQAFHPGSGLSIEAVWHGGGRVRQAYQPQFVRPGGTISGPTMMALADFAMYVGVLASIGPVPLAVTTNLNINFLRKPETRDLVAECRLLKLGKRLAVGEVIIRSDGVSEPVAHVTSTYSIPAK